MTPEKTISIGGKDVCICYCAATENGFEQISTNSINVFFPTFGKDEDGNDIIIQPAKATIADLVTLAFAGIVSAYAKRNEQPPITSEYILYDATPQERNDLITVIVELRNEWYKLPQTVKDTMKNDTAGQEELTPKND